MLYSQNGNFALCKGLLFITYWWDPKNQLKTSFEVLLFKYTYKVLIQGQKNRTFKLLSALNDQNFNIQNSDCAGFSVFFGHFWAVSGHFR